MKKSEKKDGPSMDEIIQKLDTIEARVNKIEKLVDMVSRTSTSTDSETYPAETEVEESEFSQFNSKNIELALGEYGLAWLGNIVLLFGLTFLTQYLHNKGMQGLSAIVGYASVAGIFVLSRLLFRSYANMAGMFTLLGHFLLYYFTFRLHFIAESPLLGSKELCLSMLILLNIFQFYFANKRESTILAAIAMVMTLTTAVLSDSTHVMLPLTTAVAGVFTYFLFRFQWRALLFLSQMLVYLTLIIWFLGNPIMGHQAQIVNVHNFSYLYLLAIAAIYSLIAFIPSTGRLTNALVTSTIIVNGLGFTSILSLFIATFFSTDYSFIFILIFMIGFSFSILLKLKSPWNTAHSLYALYSFVALSAAVYGFYKLPNTFLVLPVESILVILIALWFRSKLIVFLNLGLYLMLLLAYFIISDKTDLINFSFALVAIASARILKLQESRLDMKAGFFQSVYLFLGFGLVLFSLYKSLPGQFVVLSWILAAIIYFAVSRLINEPKYRWMSIATFIATAFYLFIVDLARIDMIYRIITFLALAFITIVVSIIYSKSKKTENKTG